MFLRKNRQRMDGKVYEFWTLCESFRTGRGPRQRVVASLGKLTDEDIEALLVGRASSAKQSCFWERQMNRLTEKLVTIDTALRGHKNKTIDTDKQERRIGRWPGKYCAAARLLEVEVVKDHKGRAVGLCLTCPIEKGHSRNLSQGPYCF